MSTIVHPEDRPTEITCTLTGRCVRLTEGTRAEGVLACLGGPESWGRAIGQCPGLLGDARVWSEVAVTPWSELDDAWCYNPHQHIELS